MVRRGVGSLRPVFATDRFALTWWTVLLVAAVLLLTVRPSLGELGGSGTEVAFLLFAGLVVFWDLRPIVASKGLDPQGVNLSTAFVFAAMIRWGLGPALLILAAGTVAGEIARRRNVAATIFNVAQYTLCYAAARAILDLAGTGSSAAGPGTVTVGDLVPLAAAGVTYHLLNLSLVSLLLASRSGRPFLEELLDDIGYYTATTAAVLAMAPLLVVVVDVERAFVLLVLPPLLAVHRTAAISVRQEYLSQHDPLTALPNRKRLEHVVDQALDERQDDGRAALLLLDLDRFKQVNDTLGHQAGDELLVQVAARLREVVRDDDVVARFGGDEFGVWLPSASREKARDVAARLRQCLQAPFELSTMVVDVDASVGIAVFPEDGGSLEALLRCADVAMYAAKESEQRIEVYASERDHNTVHRLGLVAELRGAVAGGELELHYQPKISFADRSIVGVEALVRWRHPERGLLMPVDFLVLAEQSGLMRELTDEVVRQALAQAAAWRDAGLSTPVAVNITPRDLADARFAMTLAIELARHDLPPQYLRLEVTEHTLMDALGVTSRVRAIADLGLDLSLDDFGTGYSSLSHLRRLPVTELKIDRSFVREVHEGDAIVRSIVQLAHNLGLTTVAEGVETAEDWHALKALGCDVAQGYLFSRPLCAARATACLEAGTLAPLERAAASPTA